ncbi:MAG TPA: tetratricopeptide repeat protein, partial [Chitinophagaceae bacterium]|nr:tetratricopeptide repeat protein [Chitinophagaceae bacterium]
MKSLITALFTFLFSSALTQNPKLDSLDRLISKATSDTAKINLINKKTTIVSRINIDSGIELSKKTIAEAKSIKYKYGEATARLRLASNYCMKGAFASAAENLNISKNIYQSLKDSLGLCNTFSGYGMMYGMQSKYDTSIQYLEKAIAIAERNNFKDNLNTYYGNIAIGYQMQSNFLRALQYQQKSLDLAKAQNDVSSQAYTSLNMGLTYSNMDDTIRAKQLLFEAVRLAKNEKLKNVELYAYSNLANLYSKKREIQKSYEFALKAASLGKEMGDYGIQAASLSKAAEALGDMKKFPEAETLAKQAITIADSSSQTFNIYQANAAMGLILKQQEKYKEAIPFLEKSVAVLEATDLYNEASGTTYNNLSVCYEKTGNFSKALSFYKTSAEIKDSVRSRDNIRKATELSMNYEFDKKQEAQRIEQKNKDAITRDRQLALTIVFGLAFISAIGAFIAYRNKQKANFQLQKQKGEIQTTLTKLKETQAQLIQSEKMASLGELTAGIAHEIQNPLNFVNNFSDVNRELIEEMKEELQGGNMEGAIAIANNIAENEEKLNHHGKRADAIVKGMLQHSSNGTGQKEPTDINKLADEYLRLSYHGLRAKDKNFHALTFKNFDPNIGKINIIPQDIGRVLLNLFTNAFYSVTEKNKRLNKFAQSAPQDYEPSVFVTTEKLNNVSSINGDRSETMRIEIRVRDNGMGVQQKVLD